MENLNNFIKNLKEKPFIKSLINDLKSDVYLVGGATRDLILNKPNKDIDLLIRKVKIDDLINNLNKFGHCDIVGKSFGVIKFKANEDGIEYDIALPRTEKPTGNGGHKDFVVTYDENLPIENDLIRRDARFNAMAINIKTGKFIDPFGGLDDIEKKQITLVNPQAFADDPLRLLRMVVFASCFGFTIEPFTMKMIQENAAKIKEIPAERILTEFDKILKKGSVALGAQLLHDTGLFKEIFGKNTKFNEKDPWNKVRTMGEFIFLLTKSMNDSSSEYFKNVLKGDINSYKEIKALEQAFQKHENNPIINRGIAFNIYNISSMVLDSEILPDDIKIAANELKSGKYPKTIQELDVDGNDLIKLGLKGKEIGDTLKSLLIKIFADKIKNNKKELLASVNNKDKINESTILNKEGVADKYAEKEFNIPDPNTKMDVKAKSEILKNIEKPYAIINDKIHTNGKSIPVFKNPKSLTNFDANVRAIVDVNGNLYVSQENGRFNHGTMAMLIGLFDNDDDLYKSSSEYQLLHRRNNTNAFGLSDTGLDRMDASIAGKRNTIKILQTAKRRNPQYDFYPEYFVRSNYNSGEPVGINEDIDGQPEMQEKKDVNYIDKTTMKNEHCGNCGWFKENKCGMVKGEINSNGWCNLWGTKKFCKENINEEYHEVSSGKYDVDGNIVDVCFFAKKYDEWNNQDGENSGYSDPTEASVLEFFQNNFEDFSYNKKLKKELLMYLTDRDLLKESLNENNDYSKEKTALLRSKTISKEMKEEILKYFGGGSTYHEGGHVHGLIKSKKFTEKTLKSNGVSLGADKDGFYCYTHRQRSKSYESPEKILIKDIEFTESTG